MASDNRRLGLGPSGRALKQPLTDAQVAVVHHAMYLLWHSEDFQAAGFDLMELLKKAELDLRRPSYQGRDVSRIMEFFRVGYPHKFEHWPIEVWGESILTPREVVMALLSWAGTTYPARRRFWVEKYSAE